MKRKSSHRVKAATIFVSPAVGGISSAAKRIGPLVHDAADRVGPLTQSAAERVTPLAQSAADRVGPLVQSAAGNFGPYAHQAVGRVSPYAVLASDKVSPYAQQALSKVSPYAQQAAGVVTPYAHQAAEILTPYATLAKVRSAQVAQDAVDKFGPRLDVAWQTVPPAIEAARGRFNDDVVPRLNSALSAAAASPVAIEAGKRGRATLAAAKGELVLPEEKSKSRWIKRLAVVAVVGGVAVVAAKTLLGSKDDDWQAARPAATYPTSDHKDTVTPAQEDTVTGPSAADAQDRVKTSAGAPLVPGDSTDQGADQTVVEHLGKPSGDPTTVAPGRLSENADTGRPTDRESSDASTTDPSRYAEGDAYVGDEPPEGFTIKANERSMKYHTLESTGYLHTNTNVWFSSEDAAEKAGFVRAQG